MYRSVFPQGMQTWYFLFCHLACVTPTPFYRFCSSLPGFELLPPIERYLHFLFFGGLPSSSELPHLQTEGRNSLGVCFPRAVLSQWLSTPGAKVIHTHQTGRHSCWSSLWDRVAAPLCGTLPESYMCFDFFSFLLPRVPLMFLATLP